MRIAAILGCLAVPAVTGAAQAQKDTSGPPETQTATDQTPTFKTRVNLVVVPVVVYDKKGQPVGSLKREDFQIFDEGKPQEITSFNLESNDEKAQSRAANSALADAIEGQLPLAPAHFFAYLFDDLHLSTGDLQQVRQAAKKHLNSAMGPEDRAAVYTTSGFVSLEFTNDKVQLAKAMDWVTRNSLGGAGESTCPYMSEFLARKIEDEFGGSAITPAWDGVTFDVWNCRFQRERDMYGTAREMALDAARVEAESGRANTLASLRTITTIVRRLAAVPGTRTLVLISPGFLTDEEHVEQNAAISLATASNIVINALDARGLYTQAPDPSGESGPTDPDAVRLESPLISAANLMQSNVMVELTDGTGGKFIRDTNDLFGGLNQLASPPRFVYMLAFKPQELKQNGSYHRLKVVVATHPYKVQARRGYYESTNAGNPEQQLTEDLVRALFSREEVHNLPVTIRAEYTKPDSLHTKLTVVTHIDTKDVRFRRANNTNNDDLTVVCGLFDLNGNYVDAKKQAMKLRLTDGTLQQIAEGINVNTDFEVKPGPYLIRVVVKDSQDALLTTVNSSAMVP